MSVIGQVRQEILAELPAIVRDVVRAELVALGVVHDKRETESVKPEPEPELVETEPPPGSWPSEPVEAFDPADLTVSEVLERLDAANEAERERILDLERAGRNRAGVLRSVT